MLRLSKGNQSIGLIKSKPEDFVVEEITKNGTILELGKSYTQQSLGMEELQEGKFTIFVLQKNNWNTAQALKSVARKFRRGVKSTGFAGTKDRSSVSTQLCSIFGVKPDAFQNMHIKDISINGAWFGNSKIEMGDLLGNHFEITLKDVEEKENILGIIEELNGVFPNYYGEQRFGNRGNNVAIGVDILRGDFKSAALKFLTDTQNERNEEGTEARKRLATELDFKNALSYFPEYLKYERMMIEYLSKYPDNYANAIRKLPRSISLMFVHSVEAQVFNRELEERIKTGLVNPTEKDIICYEDFYGFPDLSTMGKFDPASSKKVFLVGNILGYDTKDTTELEKQILEELDLSLDDFKVKGLNELNSKGTNRVLFAPFNDFKYSFDEEVKLSFSLPAGAYATAFMYETIEQSNQ
jgi:tRNA pseudouridine13 synthase